MTRPAPLNSPAVLITGAAARLGRHIAEHLAARGYPIALHYHHSKSSAEEAAAAIKSRGGVCETFAGDLSNPRYAAKLLPQVKKRFPRLGGLINNASVYQPSSLKTLKLEQMERDYTLHLLTPLILSRDFARLTTRGCIINILDTQITNYRTAYFSYLLMKKCLGELTKMAAIELAPAIRVNAIAPGVILAPSGPAGGSLRKKIAAVPLERQGSPEDIARAAVYLLENTYITGQTIFVDGGLHLI